MNSPLENEVSAVSDQLFNLEHRLNELLESIIDLYLVTHRSLLNATIEDLQKMETEKHEQLDVVLVTIKMLLDICRKANGALNNALVLHNQPISQAEQRVREQLENYRKKGL